MTEKDNKYNLPSLNPCDDEYWNGDCSKCIYGTSGCLCDDTSWSGDCTGCIHADSTGKSKNTCPITNSGVCYPRKNLKTP